MPVSRCHDSLAHPRIARTGGPCRPEPMEEIVPTYRAPVDEVMFLLTDVLKVPLR